MDDLHHVLVRFFRNVADAHEKEQVELFRKQNPKEFELLEKMWSSREQIQIQVRDVNKAWQRFQKSTSNKTKQVSLVGYRFGMLKWAAMATVALAGVLAAYLIFFQKANQEEFVTAIDPMTITLDDGTVVKLNKGASFWYPSGFESDTRQVKLKGEAYFDVAKDPKKPFIIDAYETRVRVLGTSFNVASSNALTKVSVKEGKVAVSGLQEQKKVIVTKGFTAVHDNGKLLKNRTLDLNYDSWNTGVFSFKETPLPKVVASLNTYYSSQFVLAEGFGEECTLTADFEKSSLEEIAEIIQLTCNLEAEYRQGKYFFINAKEGEQ